MSEAESQREKLKDEHYYDKDVEISRHVVMESDDLIKKKLQNEFNQYIETKWEKKQQTIFKQFLSFLLKECFKLKIERVFLSH